MDRGGCSLYLSGSHVLTGDSGSRSHQRVGRPCDEKEKLAVRNRESCLCGTTLFKRTDEGKHQYAADVHGNALETSRQPELEQFSDDLPVRSIAPLRK